MGASEHLGKRFGGVCFEGGLFGGRKVVKDREGGTFCFVGEVFFGMTGVKDGGGGVLSRGRDIFSSTTGVEDRDGGVFFDHQGSALFSPGRPFSVEHGGKSFALFSLVF